MGRFSAMLSLLRLDTKIPRTAGLLTKTAKLICESSQLAKSSILTVGSARKHGGIEADALLEI